MSEFPDFDETMGEEAFRAACARQCARHPDLPPLKTVAAVGAYHADFGGSDVDSDRLTRGLVYLARSGVPIAPDFEVDKVNFLYERNYLAETKPADLVFVSYVLGIQLYGRAIQGHQYEPSKMGYLRNALEQAADQPRFLDQQLGGILHSDNSPANWCRRAEQGGAKMIYTHGGKHEIGTHTYSARFAELIASPDADKTKDDTRGVADLYGEPLDIPLPWSGFCADKDYLARIAPALDGAATDLARRAQRLLHPAPVFSVDKAPAPGL